MNATKITILNKLNRLDSSTGLDVWYKTILNDIPYKKTRVTSIEGSVVSMGESYTILIPFLDNYLPYEKWKLSPSSGFTLNQNDLIILQEITEQPTPSNIITIQNSYKPYVCNIRSIFEVESKYSVNYQFRVEGI